MTDSSSDCTYEEDYVMYKHRPEWRDVTPVEQDDGPNPVVAIAYSEQFRDVYDYLRAVLRSGEKSVRALDLTSDAAQLNPANYTVWQYRRDCLLHLKSNLNFELEYISDTIREHPKNYQVWHHRRVIVEWLKDPSQELPFTTAVLGLDSKNYHAWQHRQWVVTTFKLYAEEMEYVDSLLISDVRNNSAWNQRHFVIIHTTGFTSDVVIKELNFTLSRIKEVENNESAWNYLRGVLCHTKSGNISSEESVLKFCQELYESGCRGPYLLAFIIDVCEEFMELGTSHDFFTIQKALQLCEDLGLEYDKIRKEYWNYMSRKITQKFESRKSTEAK